MSVMLILPSHSVAEEPTDCESANESVSLLNPGWRGTLAPVWSVTGKAPSQNSEAESFVAFHSVWKSKKFSQSKSGWSSASSPARVALSVTNFVVRW